METSLKNTANSLIWKEESRKIVYSCPIFKVEERTCRSPDNYLKPFTVLATSDWAIVIPALEKDQKKKFVMVKQWRHGADALSLEFPGGVFEKNEDAEAAAARELREETGYTAGKIEKLGEFSPNPAIMNNKVHFFLATDLSAPQEQELDDDEFVEIEVVNPEDVLSGLGKPPYIHALMGTAIALYLKGPLFEKTDKQPD